MARKTSTKASRKTKAPSSNTVQMVLTEYIAAKEDLRFAHTVLQEQIKLLLQAFVLALAFWAFVVWGLLTSRSSLPQPLADLHRAYIVIAILAFEAAIIGYIEVLRFSTLAASDATGGKLESKPPNRTIGLCGTVTSGAVAVLGTEVFFWCLFDRPATVLIWEGARNLLAILHG